MTTDETVAVPRWAAELLADPHARRCGVCVGHSPPWDGHDKNPPCVGYAREVLAAALGDGRD